MGTGLARAFVRMRRKWVEGNDLGAGRFCTLRRQGENHKDYCQDNIRFTTKDGVLYALVLAPPTEYIVIRTLATGGLLDREIVGIELMGSAEKLNWSRNADALTIQLPETLPGKIVNGFRICSK